MTEQLSWSIDPASADEARTVLLSASRVCFPTHQNVDADGLGSPLALLLALRQLGGEGFLLISDGKLPQSLRFLPGVDSAVIYGTDRVPDYDMLCMVDCSDRRRLGAFYQDDPSRVEGQPPIVNIDHHITNDLYGNVNIVAPTAASAAEIVADIVRLWEIDMTRDIAECLLAGIYGDTLGLRTEATTARTMRTAADLVDSGANPAQITEDLFRIKPASTVCVWREVLKNVGWTGSVIWTEVSKDILSSCSAEPSEAEGLVNFLAGTQGSLVSAILYQTSDGWRTSLRSLKPEVDVAEMAAEFGGGGHPRAAGCQVIGGVAERDAFLERLAVLASTAYRHNR
jgi:bifunctional oligoribonuclease and PAP phosphatase NrnA